MTDEQVIQRMVALYKERNSIAKIPWLPKPSDCIPEVWDTIVDCWVREPSQRPPFKRIHASLREEQRQRINPENHSWHSDQKNATIYDWESAVLIIIYYNTDNSRASVYAQTSPTFCMKNDSRSLIYETSL